MIIEEIKKDIRILLAYPAEIVFWIISPLLWVVPLVFQGKALIGGLQSTAFGHLAGTGEYIPYVLIGGIFSTYMFTAVWSMGNALRNEMFYGTLEHILSSPVRPIYILLGKGLYNSLLSQTAIGYTTTIILGNQKFHVVVLNRCDCLVCKYNFVARTSPGRLFVVAL